ncbi:transposase [Pseudoroseomonas wenyumeiae]|uniref:Transposase n=1 Tax=Teichococcus wenyumeiae TaxID=2478470 RepID=A0A3A9J6A5_9PROT|nr:hypothetical protein D6Z83_22090 [Pseudoroseomonas wenyumeiae]RMI15222.1 transposase [Pseudoroseomonas wenyumeiae]
MRLPPYGYGYGYPRIHILLQRERWKINRKRVYRLYRLEGLSLRRKRPRRHVTAARRLERGAAVKPNQQWSMDFVSDALFDGRRIRAPTLMDNDTREALAIVVDGGIRGEHVVQAVEQIVDHRGAPELIRIDHGPEFVSKVLDRWAYERGGDAGLLPPRQADRQLLRGKLHVWTAPAVQEGC